MVAMDPILPGTSALGFPGLSRAKAAGPVVRRVRLSWPEPERRQLNRAVEVATARRSRDHIGMPELVVFRTLRGEELLISRRDQHGTPSVTRFCQPRSPARPIASWSPGCVSWSVVRRRTPPDSVRSEAPGTRELARHAAPGTSKYARIPLRCTQPFSFCTPGSGGSRSSPEWPRRSPRSAAAALALRRAERWGLLFMIALDVQMLLGLLLYGMLSPYTAAEMKDFGAAMRDPVLRFWAVEHLTMMLSAVILVHVGRVLGRKSADAAGKRPRLLVCFGAGPFCFDYLGNAPWPGLGNNRLHHSSGSGALKKKPIIRDVRSPKTKRRRGGGGGGGGGVGGGGGRGGAAEKGHACVYDLLVQVLPPVPIVQRPRTWPFQGQNAGSNPAGDAKLRYDSQPAAAAARPGSLELVKEFVARNEHQAPLNEPPRLLGLLNVCSQVNVPCSKPTHLNSGSPESSIGPGGCHNQVSDMTSVPARLVDGHGSAYVLVPAARLVQLRKRATV